MKEIFNFTDVEEMYQRCILASIAHAVMVGKYDMLTGEQWWDETNYNFQNFEGIRGVISFSEKDLACVLQNEMIASGEDAMVLLEGADNTTISFVQNEALPYMMSENENSAEIRITALFWSKGKKFYANVEEEQLMKKTDNILLPFLYSFEDAKKYWTDYYEMTDPQSRLVEEIYEKRILSKGKIKLGREIKNQLGKWFEDISNCLESFLEMNIDIEN